MKKLEMISEVKIVTFCPYCGGRNILFAGIQYDSSKVHRLCKDCDVYFEIGLDRVNDFPQNNIDYQKGPGR